MQKIVILLILLTTTSAYALSIEPHFFGSFEAARTSSREDVTFEGIKNEWTVGGLTTAGINLSGQINEKSTALVQLIKDNNKIVVDLVQYQINLPYEVRGRFGRQRLPAFLMSEVIQVKALYPWLMAPHEVYNKIPVRSFSGGSFEKEFGSFMLHVVGGDASEQFVTGDVKYKVDTNEFYGIRLNYRSPNFESYASFIKTNVNLNVETQVPTGAPVPSHVTVKGDVPIKNLEAFTTGFNWSFYKWILYSEFVQTRSSNSDLHRQRAAYGTLGYALNDDWLVLGTFSTDIEKDITLSPAKSTTYTLSSQYKIDLYTVLKFGVSQVDFREVTANSPLGASNSAFGYTGDPGGDYQIYDVQLGFVF